MYDTAIRNQAIADYQNGKSVSSISRDLEYPELPSISGLLSTYPIKANPKTSNLPPHNSWLLNENLKNPKEKN